MGREKIQAGREPRLVLTCKTKKYGPSADYSLASSPKQRGSQKAEGFLQTKLTKPTRLEGKNKVNIVPR